MVIKLQCSMDNANDTSDIYMLCTLILRHAFRSCPPFLLQKCMLAQCCFSTNLSSQTLMTFRVPKPQTKG